MGLAAYRPQLRYLLIDESAHADADLASMRNLVVVLFRLENSRDAAVVREVLLALAEWLADPEQMELRRSFLIWLREAFLKTRLPNVSKTWARNCSTARIAPPGWRGCGRRRGRTTGSSGQWLEPGRGIVRETKGGGAHDGVMDHHTVRTG